MKRMNWMKKMNGRRIEWKGLIFWRLRHSLFLLLRLWPWSNLSASLMHLAAELMAKGLGTISGILRSISPSVCTFLRVAYINQPMQHIFYITFSSKTLNSYYINEKLEKKKFLWYAPTWRTISLETTYKIDLPEDWNTDFRIAITFLLTLFTWIFYSHSCIFSNTKL